MLHDVDFGGSLPSLLANPGDTLWERLLDIESCVKFLDTLAQPTESSLKVGGFVLSLSKDIDEKGTLSPRGKPGANGRNTLRKKKIAQGIFSRKKDESPGEAARSIELSKRSAHSNVLVTPRPGNRMRLSVSNPNLNETFQEEESEEQKEFIQLFNKKPQEGIDFVTNCGMVKNEEDIARLLYSLDLNNVKLGEYLSDNEPNRAEILSKFISFIGIRKEMDFDLALRKFLYCFRLPGEAQKIDRLMKAFSTYYYELHKDDEISNFPDIRAVYVVAFSTIMLNTDLHNPQVKNKMTEKQFIDNTHYESEAVPTEFLVELFEKISCEEIKFDLVNVFLPDALKKGWLYLHSKKRWKRRWVVLTDQHLYIFKRPAEATAIFGISLVNCTLEETGKEKGRKFCIRILLPPDKNKAPSYTVEDDGRSSNHILLSALQSNQELEVWAKAINNIIDEVTDL